MPNCPGYNYFGEHNRLPDDESQEPAPDGATTSGRLEKPPATQTNLNFYAKTIFKKSSPYLVAPRGVLLVHLQNNNPATGGVLYL